MLADGDGTLKVIKVGSMRLNVTAKANMQKV